MAKGQTLQEPFLNALRRERVRLADVLESPRSVRGKDRGVVAIGTEPLEHRVACAFHERCRSR